MSDYTIYIDEAGDLGIGRGTRWFVLSAVAVSKAAEPEIRKRIIQLRTELGLKVIHMRNINDFYRRAFIVRELDKEDFTYMNVLVDTQQFDGKKIPNPLIAYNYMCKYVLQRVSRFLEDKGKTADIMLSARGTSRDNELIQYIQNKLLPYPSNHINAALFGKILAKTAASWDLLQLADVCATTMFLTYEINGYGFSTPCFSSVLENHLYRKYGKVEPYGIKFFTSAMKPNVEELRKTRVCAKKERTPGATAT